MFPIELTTIDEFFEFILRQLGGDAHRVELSPENLMDILTKSMKEFQRYFPTEGLTLKRMVIQTVMQKSVYNINDMLIYERKTTATGEATIVPCTPDIFQVIDISPHFSFAFAGYPTTNMAYDYLFFFNTGFAGDWTRAGMETVTDTLMQLSNADYINTLFRTKYTCKWDRNSKELNIFPTPKQDGHAVITAYTRTSLTDLMNNDMFQKLVEANSFIQWGKNCGKYGTIEINGGGKIDADWIKTTGKELKEEIVTMMFEQQEPLEFFVE